MTNEKEQCCGTTEKTTKAPFNCSCGDPGEAFEKMKEMFESKESGFDCGEMMKLMCEKMGGCKPADDNKE